MNRAKNFIALTFLLAFAVCVSAQKLKVGSFKIEDKDKSEILKQVFADGFEKLIENENFHLCTIPLVDGKKIILIRTAQSDVFPKEFGEFRFKFLSQAGIEDEIKSNDGDCYFEAENFQAVNSQKVKISLWRWIRVITVSNGVSQYPSGWVAGQGLVYEAAKRGGRWRVKFLNATALFS